VPEASLETSDSASAAHITLITGDNDLPPTRPGSAHPAHGRFEVPLRRAPEAVSMHADQRLQWYDSIWYPTQPGDRGYWCPSRFLDRPLGSQKRVEERFVDV